MDKKREAVAFLMIGIPNLAGSGGAERFFGDFFEIYNDQQEPKRKLVFISDDFSNLNTIGKLQKHTAKLFKLKVNRDNKFTNLQWRYPSLKKLFLFLNEIPVFFSLFSIIKKQKIKILHIPLYEDKDYTLLKLIDTLPGFLRPRIVINIVDCRIPYYYYKTEGVYSYASATNYARLFSNIKIDAIYSWYHLFKKFATEKKLIRSNPPITVINSRFTNTPCIQINEIHDKKNIIVFAGRLDIQKNPMFFLNAIDILAKRKNGLNNWKVEMYGKGELETEIKDFIETRNLSSIVSLSYTYDLPSVLRHSKCYVSTQEFENFPSLAMAEAMAKGNIIISRNVGQTAFFVKNNMNGFLTDEDTPGSLAESLSKMLLLNTDDLIRMGSESINILQQEHNAQNFIKQTDTFWDTVMSAH